MYDVILENINTYVHAKMKRWSLVKWLRISSKAS